MNHQLFESQNTLHQMALLIRKGVLLLTSFIVFLIGITVLTGWHLQNIDLIQISSRFVAMVYNTAISLTLLSLAEILIVLRYNLIGRFLLIIVAILATLSGLQYILQADFGIDQLFLKYNLSIQMEYPGRMALNTAVCFLFTSIALFLYSAGNSEKYAISVTIFAAFSLSIAWVAFFGYVGGLESVVGWVHFSRMAIHTSISFILIATPIAVFSFIDSLRLKRGVYIIPIGAFFALSLASFSFWQGFRIKDVYSINKIAEENSKHLTLEIEEAFVSITRAIQRLGLRWEVLGGYPNPLWDVDANNYLHDIDFLTEVIAIDSNFDVIHKTVEPGNIPYGFDFQAPEIQKKLLQENSFLVFQKITNQVLAITPISIDHKIKGAVVGVISVSQLLDKLMLELNLSNYFVIVQSEDIVIFSGGNTKSKLVGLPIEGEINPLLIPWKTKIFITESSGIQALSNLGFFILFTGFVFALVFSFAIYFWIDSRNKAYNLEKITEDLKAANTVALQNTIAKGLFLASMSHEIRTPLNAVIGTAQLLAETEISEIQKKYVERITNSSQNLLELINQILDFSKIESGTIRPDAKPMVIEEIFSTIIEGVQNKVHEKGLMFLVDLPIPPFPVVISDPVRFQQVVSNLVNNAIKFTEKGFIRLSAQVKVAVSENIVIRIEVTDSGIGITESDIKKLSDKFVQINPEISRRYGGVGLGLPICKKIIEILGGRMGVLSEFGKGSTFWVELPLTTYKNQDRVECSLQNIPILLSITHEGESKIIEKMVRSWGARSVIDPSDHPSIAIISSDKKEELEKILSKNIPSIIIAELNEQIPLKKGVVVVTRPVFPIHMSDAIQQLRGK